MIKSFNHKGLEKFFLTGSVKGIQAIHAAKISRILFILNNLTDLNGLSTSMYRLHKLKGNMQDHYSVTVQANWRITFKYDEANNDVYIVDYQDYH